MGRRGPKPDPASVKEAKGNPGRRRIGKDPEQAAPGGRVAPPEWLKGEGLEIWRQLAPRLASLKLLSQSDAGTFGRYCRNYARWLKMQNTLDTEGETYESESQHGKLKRAHPAFLIADRLDRRLEAVEDRFGLNPAERQRIFAARAQGSGQSDEPDLFGNRPAPRDRRKPPQAPAKPGSPLGLLN